MKKKREKRKKRWKKERESGDGGRGGERGIELVERRLLGKEVRELIALLEILGATRAMTIL